MENRIIVQWDKDALDTVGLLKIDILALGMLSAMRRRLEMVSARRGERFELADIPKEDANTYETICRADTIGVFQIESRTQMSMLPRMKPRVFYDLVIEVAIIRPGPIQGGMIHPYLRQREGADAVTYPSPEMEKVLSRTLGIPIFHEQVRQIAMVAAGFTAGEAISCAEPWQRGRERGLGGVQGRAQVRYGGARLQRRLCQWHHPPDSWFAEYGFPESHAASFALLAYASSWMKCHEPAAFLVALLNSQPMGFYSPSQLVQDAAPHGVEVCGVDINISDWNAKLEPSNGEQPAVSLALNRIRGMDRNAAWRGEEARAVRPFKDLHDLGVRAELDAAQLKLLASANALASISGNRHQAVWNAAGSVPYRGLLHEALIVEDVLAVAPGTEGQEVVADYRHMGLTFGRHPLALLRERLLAMRFMSAEVLNLHGDARLARGCGLVMVRQRPETAKGAVFLTFEDEAGTVKIIVWPSLLEEQRKEVMGARLRGVYGQWQCANDVRHLLAKRLVDLTHLLGDLDKRSRNFR